MMNSHREIFQALLDGKKLTNILWPEGSYVYLNKEGRMTAEDGGDVLPNFNFEDNYKVYKKKRLIKL